MRFHPFGSTGMIVSEVGFGGSRIGGVFAGKSSHREALTVLRQAFESGVTFYDTADMYAQGESEQLIGTAFRHCRPKVILATKGGFCLPARRNLIRRIKPLVRPLIQAFGLKRAKLPTGLSGALSQNFSAAYLAKALEGSLRRLQTDYVDLYQLHSPSATFMQTGAFGEALETLEKLKTAGKLRFYGVATEVPDDAPCCVFSPGIASLQVGFGLLDLEALESNTLAKAAARGLAVIARGCFAGGLLKDDLETAQLKLATPKWERILRLREHCRATGRTVLDTAFQFCRNTPGVSLTLLGMRSTDHLRSNLRYIDAPGLPAEEYVALRELVKIESEPMGYAPG